MIQLSQDDFLKTGTTGLAIKFKNGIIIAADKRVSGSYVVKKDFDKIHMLNKTIGMAISGLVSDAMSLVDVMRAELQLYEYDNGVEPSVKTAAKLLGVICHSSYRSMQFYWVQLICGGVDDLGGHLYNIDPSGAVSEDDYMVIGSGSLFALSKLEDSWKEGLNKEEAVALAKQALKLAISRDLYTGDGMDFYIITKDGLEHKVVKLMETEV
ncbi:MAG: Proteasome subunit beta precursor [Candidatus Heimdallarchaeota archaeon LC_3]|nr:MAG: Proteasome subunit beta precursor [Candidatus Heimdallarchaeota archaeon LC_3]